MKHVFSFFSTLLCLIVSVSMVSCGDGNYNERPSAPAGVTCTGGSGSVTLEWTPAADADSYTIYWNMTGDVTTEDNRISGVDSPYVHSALRNGARYHYVITSENHAGASPFSEEVSATPEYGMDGVVKRLAPDAEVGDWFGFTVSVSGDYAIAGTRASGKGAAYIFHKTGSALWDAGIKLIAPDEAIGFYGNSVDISGDYAVVGSPEEIVETADPIYSSGAVHIYRRTGENEWKDSVRIIAPDAESGDLFGWKVAMDGDYLVVNAPRENNQTGALYVFHRTDLNTWDNGTKLTIPGAQFDDVPWLVDISGDFIIAGAPVEDGGTGNISAYVGAAYIFHRTEVNSWDEMTTIAAPDRQMGDHFGCSVGIHGDYAVVGAMGKDTNAGVAYIFRRTGVNAWEDVTKIGASDAQVEDYFGVWVGISGDNLVIGAYYEDGGEGDPLPAAGAAYVFRRSRINAWEQVMKLTAPDPQGSDTFGGFVAIDESSVAVSAINEDGGEGDPLRATGAVYFY